MAKCFCVYESVNDNNYLSTIGTPPPTTNLIVGLEDVDGPCGQRQSKHVRSLVVVSGYLTLGSTQVEGRSNTLSLGGGGGGGE